VPSRDASSLAFKTLANGGGVATSIVSDAFSPPANSLLVCAVMIDHGGAELSTPLTVTNSGTARTWTSAAKRTYTESGNTYAHAELFIAQNPTAQTNITVTCSYAGSGSTFAWSQAIDVWTGHNTTTALGATGEGNSTTNSITPNALTTTANGSRVIGFGVDWQQLGVPTTTDQSNATFNVASWESGILLSKSADTATSGTVVTLNFDAGGTAAAGWAWVAMEIMAAAGGGDPGIVPVTHGRPVNNQFTLRRM
jgi:hypothetical protein